MTVLLEGEDTPEPRRPGRRHFSAVAELEALAASTAPIWVFDVGAHRMHWGNPAALQFWGAATVDDLRARDFSDDSPGVRKRLRNLVEASGDGQRVADTWTLYPLGHPVTVAVRCTAITVEDGRDALMVEAERPLDLVEDPGMLRMLEAARVSALMVSSFDREGRLLMQNPAAGACYGARDRADPEGRPALRRRLEDPALVARVLDVAKTGERIDTEAATATLGGRRLHRLIAERGRDPLSGEPVVILIEDDVTARREADEEQKRTQHEARLRADEAAELSRSRLLNAIEAIPDGFCLYDAEDRLVLCNQAYRDSYREKGEVFRIGERYEDMLRKTLVRGEFPEAEGREDAWIEDVVQYHRNPEGTAEHRLADGRWIRLVDRRTPDGEIVGLRTDITTLKTLEEQLRSSEERFRDFANATADWFWETDEQHRFTYMSENVARVAGVPAEWHLGRKRTDFRWHEDDEELWEEHLRTLARREPFRNFEYRRTGPGIEPRWLRISGVPVFDATGIFRGYRGNGTDITVQREMEGEIARQREALFHAQKLEAIGKLTGGLAHDFNNLLAVVQGNLELIREIDRPDEIEECIHDALEATERGARLVQQLLSFGRRARLDPRITSLDEVLGEIAPMLRRTLPETIRIEISTTPDPWPTRLDRAGLTNAVLNIALNARDAMPEGGQLTLSTGNRTVTGPASHGSGEDPVPGRYTVLTIGDTGSGMAPEVLVKAFEPFFTTKPVGSGSGLGLSMVHGFVRQSGGATRLDSAQGRGTSVTLFFPVAEESVDAGTPAKAVPRPKPSSERIMLVEDEATVRATIARQLRHLGYQVVEAGDGTAALDRLAAEPEVALVLCDVVMPGPIQGTDLAERLARERPRLPVVLMSGYSERSALDGRSPPAASYLSKPIGTADLGRAIRDAICARAEGTGAHA